LLQEEVHVDIPKEKVYYPFGVDLWSSIATYKCITLEEGRIQGGLEVV
jgi:hypothetical protein